MPNAKITPDLEMHYEVDDFADPWRPHETSLLLHGNAESGAVWYGWVPYLAREFRVVRPDMRGFGASTPMPRDYPSWSLDQVIDDFTALMDQLRIDRFHLVGAKVGGTIALRFAARHPQRIATLTVIAPQVRGKAEPERYRAWAEHMETYGVESWARMTMKGRLGSGFPPAGVEWWARLMGRTALSTQLGFISSVSGVDVTPDLANILCPTLVIAMQDSSLHSVKKVGEWQCKIPRSELLALQGDAYHVAAAVPERCARATLDFIRRVSAEAAIQRSYDRS
ncbi:MAG: alpha/beta hydrolase [Betaproteobacteria bacterium]|nr:alpha/beta hydrolase [Betaproteobacteria bacterium]